MKAKPPSRFTIALTWAVVALTIGLLVYGTLRYGFSAEVRERFWSDITGRVGGPFTFRFILQPTVGLIAALKDAIPAARLGVVEVQRPLRTGLLATSQLAMIGFIMDILYQIREFDQFYPGEAVLVVVLFAIVPYFIFHWIAGRVARWWFARRAPAER